MNKHWPTLPTAIPIVICGLLLVTGSCTSVDVSHVPFHACGRQYKDWTGTGLDFKLEHTLPDLCPSTSGTGDNLTAGGTVYETNAPSAPHTGLSKTGFVRIYENYNYNFWSGSGLLGSESQSFQWGPPCCGASSGQDWRAQLYASYTAGFNLDYAEFTMDFFQPPPGDPVGVLEITYQSTCPECM